MAKKSSHLGRGAVLKFTEAIKSQYSNYTPPPGELVGIVTHEAAYADGDIAIIGMDGRHYVLKGASKYEAASGKELTSAIEAFVTKEPPIIPGRWGYSTGSDPEIFAVDREGKVIPAFSFLPSKEKKLPWGRDGRPEGVFYDGFQAEGTTPSATCHVYATGYIQAVLGAIYREADKKFPGATLSSKSVLDIEPENYTLTQLEMGCSPSMNAYGTVGNLNGLDDAQVPFRFAGFHIHLGKVPADQNEAIETVKMIDSVSGVISVSLLQGMEDVRRRRFYGLAGEYRLPAHGLEYRVLSSSVLSHPVLVHLMLDLTRQCAAMTGMGLNKCWIASEDEVKEAINDLNVELAQKIIKRNLKLLTSMLKRMYGDQGPYDPSSIARGKKKIHENALRIINDGASKHLTVNNLIKNLGLTKTGVHTQVQSYKNGLVQYLFLED